LLLLVLAVGCLLGCYVALRQKVEAERRVLAEIIRLGGTVWHEVGIEPNGGSSDLDPPGPWWARHLLGDTFFTDRITVDFWCATMVWSTVDGEIVHEEVIPEFGDEHIELLTKVPKLTEVNFNESSVTRQAACRLKQLLPDCVVIHEGTVIEAAGTDVGP
jgi:hypothetical protein